MASAIDAIVKDIDWRVVLVDTAGAPVSVSPIVVGGKGPDGTVSPVATKNLDSGAAMAVFDDRARRILEQILVELKLQRGEVV